MSADLDKWMETVEKYGGRIGSPAANKIWDALQRSNLGSTKSLPTSAVSPVFENVISLAEINLGTPISVDVSFSYLNVFPDSLFDPGLDVGNGYVQVTWGVPGAFKHIARIDGVRGWRYPFTASFLRVDYVPIDKTVGFFTGWELEGNQQRDLRIAGMISPSMGDSVKPLTKTMFLPDVPDGGVGAAVIPDWARNYRLAGEVVGTGEYNTVLIDRTLAKILQESFATGLAGEWPNFVPMSTVYPIPQTAIFAAVFAEVDTELLKPTMVCELTL